MNAYFFLLPVMFGIKPAVWNVPDKHPCEEKSMRQASSTKYAAGWTTTSPLG